MVVALGICMTNAYARSRTSMTCAYPQIWYRPDSAMANPMLRDTITLPASYIMIVVYRPLRPDSMQQLWKLIRADDKYYSVGTHTISTERGDFPLYPNRHRSKAHIYTMVHTLGPDTLYHDVTQLFVGTDTISDTCHIELYEGAYFGNRLTQYQSLVFQTYLALKHGVTLDGVSYISTIGDTLWNATKSCEYYHRIHGFGTDSIYDFISLYSISKEDSLIRISTNDTLAKNNYVIIGDNDAELEWLQYENSLAMLHRIWKLNVTGGSEYDIQVKIDSHILQDTADTIWLAILNDDYQIVNLIFPDSVDSCYHYYNIRARTDMFISFAKHFAHHNVPRRNKQQDIVKQTESDYIDVTPNPTHGEFNVRLHIVEEKPVTIVTRDMSGKTINSQNIGSISDYEYNDRIGCSGVYAICVTDGGHNIIATADVIVY